MNNTTLQTATDLGNKNASVDITNRLKESKRLPGVNHAVPCSLPQTNTSSPIPPIIQSSKTINSGIRDNKYNGDSNTASISLPPIDHIHWNTQQQLPTIGLSYPTAQPPPPPYFPQTSPLQNLAPISQQQGQAMPAFILAPYNQAIQTQQQSYIQTQQSIIPQIYQYQQLQNYQNQQLSTPNYTVVPPIQQQFSGYLQHRLSPIKSQTREQPKQRDEEKRQEPQEQLEHIEKNSTSSSPRVRPNVHENMLPRAKNQESIKKSPLSTGKVEKPKKRKGSPKIRKANLSAAKLTTLVELLHGLTNSNKCFTDFLSFLNRNVHSLFQLSKKLSEIKNNVCKLNDPSLKELHSFIANFPKQELESLEDISSRYMEVFSLWKNIESISPQVSESQICKTLPESAIEDELIDENSNYPKVPGESVSLKVVPLKPVENQSKLEFNSHGTLHPDLSITMKLSCQHCGSTSTPEWRKGPEDAKILCNACGLFHTKLVKKFNPELARLELKRRRENGEVTNRRI
ncbi:hypothetical protein CANINC_004081 [Pichia inconspicua]|uniref:GATA-type domain-containing protein n=1 Tax=Pichia inconspicua TaxID=52247 RepID=A0A4T0WX24_9ASCO|nr:hypothetical protein CANINC_004081 [[Candida] inconspicua]